MGVVNILCLFIHVLFNDAVNSSDFTASKDWIEVANEEETMRKEAAMA
jgi:hypothetical protein